MHVLGVFAYHSTAGFRSKLERLASCRIVVHITSDPPWSGIPSDKRFACAFLEAGPGQLLTLQSWMTSLSVVHPGIRVYVIAPTRLHVRLGRALGGRAAAILPLSSTAADLEKLARSCLRRTPRRSAMGIDRTPGERIAIAEAVFRSMYETGFLIQDGIICYAFSPQRSDMGFKREGYIGHHFLEFIHPDERRKVAMNYARRMTGSPAKERYETFVRNARGEKVPVELIVNRTMFRGRPAAVGTIRDVSERHALVTMRIRREKELALVGGVTHELLSGRSFGTALGRALDLILDALRADSGAIVLSRPTGHFVPFAARQKIRGGFSAWSACGRMGEVHVEPSVLRSLRAGRAVLEAPCDDAAALGLHHLAAPLLTKRQLRGFLYLLRRTGEPFCDEDAKVLASIAGEAALGVENLRLYDDLQRSYRDLLGAQQELVRREKLAIIGNMAAQLAHEIRNPVATIMNATGQIRRRLGLRDVEAELADIVEEELERLRRLCDDLVLFSRSPAPKPRSFHLRGFLESMCSDLRDSHVLPDAIRVRIGVAPPDLEADHDPATLFPLLRNLIMNAIQSMGARGHLGLDASLQHSRLVLEVTDDGPGIPPEIRGRIFDPFFSTRPEAAGLGLAIVKNYVDEMGGALEVTSAPPGGTTVRLLLPLLSPPSQNDK